MTDTVTPPPFDILLLALSVPVVVSVALFVAHRTITYLCDGGRVNLQGVVVGLVFVSVAVGLIARPLADLWPAPFTGLELLVAPMVRVIVFIATATLWWSDVHERS